MKSALCLLLLSFSLQRIKCQSMESIESTVVKKPGETLSLSCRGSGFSFSSYDMHWIRQQAGKPLVWMGRVYSDASGNDYSESFKGRIEITRDNSKSMSYLKLSGLTEEDSAMYFCANTGVGQAFDYWGKGTMVTVTSAQPSAPKSIFTMSQCTSDSDGFVTLGCMAKGFSPADSLTFKWMDHSKKDMSDVVQYPAFGRDGDYTKISHLRVKKSDWNPQKPYQCEASSPQGKLTSKDISPPSPPPDVRATVYLTVPTKMELDNDTATFTCLAQRFSPNKYTFKWSLDDNGVRELTEVIDKYEKSEKIDSVTEYSATSILQISAKEWKKPDVKVICEFKHQAGDERKVAENTVIIPGCNEVTIYIEPPSLEAMLKNRTGVLKCKASAESSGFTKITIRADNRDIAEKEESDNIDHTELEAPIGYEEWSNGTKFTCTVEHNELAEPKSTTFVRENGKNPTKPTVFVLAPPEQKPGETMTLTCYVKDFYPKEVFVSWLADDEPVTSKYSTSLPIQKDKTFSVYSQLTVTDSKWKNGTVFSCVVYHEGIDERMRVLARSINDNTDKAGVINLNMNTPTSCKT